MNTKEAIELVKKILFYESNLKLTDKECSKIIEDSEKYYNDFYHKNN